MIDVIADPSVGSNRVFYDILSGNEDTDPTLPRNHLLLANNDRTFVSQMERGIRQPTLTTLFKLSKALEIQPSPLVSRTEKHLR